MRAEGEFWAHPLTPNANHSPTACRLPIASPMGDPAQAVSAVHQMPENTNYTRRKKIMDWMSAPKGHQPTSF